MCKYYLTDNIFIKNKKYYIEESDNNITKLNNKNWYKYLKNHRWDRLCLSWRNC